MIWTLHVTPHRPRFCSNLISMVIRMFGRTIDASAWSSLIIICKHFRGTLDLMCGLPLNRLTLSMSTHTYASSQKLIKQIGSRNFYVIFTPEYPPSGRYRSNAPKYERWMRHQLVDHFWAMEDCLSLFGQFPELTLVFHTRNSACIRVHPQALEPQRTASRCVRRTHVSITPSNLPRIRITRVHTDSLRNSKFSQTAGASWKALSPKRRCSRS